MLSFILEQINTGLSSIEPCRRERWVIIAPGVDGCPTKTREPTGRGHVIMVTLNQNPEQIARDQIDKHLTEAEWIVQNKKAVDFNAGLGIAVREYQTDIGPADYALFVGATAVGVIEAKPEDWGHKITVLKSSQGATRPPNSNG